MKRSFVLVCITFAVGAVACSKSLTLDDGNAAALRGDGKKRADAGSADGGQADEHAQAAAADAGGATEHTQSSPSESNGSADGGGYVEVVHWGGNVEACSSDAAETGDACSAPEGTVCAYTWPDANDSTQQRYQECTCRADCGGAAPATRWDCYSVTQSVQAACPPEKPEDGSSCFGLRGNDCYYPTETQCSCRGDAQAAAWSCESEGPQPGAHPAGIDESTHVGDLSAAQRAAWCDWLTQREPGYPAWPELEPDSDGFYPNTGCAGAHYLSCELSMPRDYAASACIANLELSSCDAPLYELTECALTLQHRGSDHRCGHYIDVPGCAGTIILNGSAIGAAPDACRLRVR